jgi:pimeloyl-ACP methyl ester carboxylesterase
MKFQVQGSGAPVLLLHGLPTSGRLWDPTVAQLRDSFSCVVVDLPGMGDSPPLPDGSLDPDDYAAELDALREQLGIESWHVVGHDAGATIAVHYATTFPHRTNRLVLCSSPIFPELQPPLIFRLMRLPVLGELFAPLVCWILLPMVLRLMIVESAGANREIVRSFLRPFSGFRGPGRLLHIVRWGDPKVVLARTAALLPKITAPTLIVHSRNDGTLPLDFALRAAELIPDSGTSIMDCGHFMPLNGLEAFSSNLAEFFRAKMGTGLQQNLPAAL